MTYDRLEAITVQVEIHSVATTPTEIPIAVDEAPALPRIVVKRNMRAIAPNDA